MAQRRVVITGLGVVNALAMDAQQYFQALLNGVIGIKRIKAFDPANFPSQIGGETPEFTIGTNVPKTYRKATKLMSRDIELAVVAADAAIRDSGLVTKAVQNGDGGEEFDPKRAGVNIGAGLICCDLEELASAVEHGTKDGHFDLKKWGREGMEALTPLWLLKYLPNMLGCHVSIIHDLQGPNNAVTCAEASGQLAIGEAYRTILRNDADIMIAGGAECKVNPVSLVRQCLLGRTSTHYNEAPQQASRPFDRDADGTVVGDGAGMVVLEDLEHARARNAPIYAELVGFGASMNFSENFVDPQPQGTGISIALQKALKEAGVGPEQIDLMVPHGLAVASSDRAEAHAIQVTFGAKAKTVPVFASKSRIGNCGAGAGAIDLVTTVLALSRNTIPATMNCPNCPGEYGLNIIQENTEVEINAALSCCNTFGGQTAALAIRKLNVERGA